MGNSKQYGWIGVDVGTHTVTLAQAVRDDSGTRLHRAAVIQRPSSWSGDDTLALEQTISSSPEIRAALECGRFLGRNAVATLPMNVYQLRGLKVPPGNDGERRTIIANELAEDWVDPRSPMEFDFWEMDAASAEKGSDGFNVSILAASRPWIAQLWRDCHQSGLDCWGIDGTPLTLARAVALAGGAMAGRRALAIDWGYSNTTLTLVQDGRPLYTRRIHNCSFGVVLEAIMATFNVTLDEAQHLSLRLGIVVQDEEHASDPQAAMRGSSAPASVSSFGKTATQEGDLQTQLAITDSAAGALDELVRQVGRTLQFMEAQRRHLHPAAIWLMGGGASLRNIGPHLRQAFSIPVHLWRLDADDQPIGCAAGRRCALFASAAALSAAAWRAA